jgi:hypothetical protein
MIKIFNIISVLIYLFLLAVSIKFYIDYSLIYESQVYEMGILYPENGDIEIRGLEIKNILFFDRIIIIGLSVNLALMVISNFNRQSPKN